MKILMCPPKFFSVDYEINPWMHRENQVNREKAKTQWDNLVQTYANLGVEVQTIEPVEDLPDMVFTANAALVRDGKAILANFRYKERKNESIYFRSWFENEGYRLEILPENAFFEGEGEALWIGNTLVAGFGFRANLAGHEKLRETFKGNLTSVRLIDSRFYHLDTCFFPVKEDTAAFFPQAFADESKEVLKNLIPNLIEVDEEEAKAFGCNSVVVKNKIIMPQGLGLLPKKLNELGFEVISLDISEFKKSGGGVRCLTLTLEP